MFMLFNINKVGEAYDNFNNNFMCGYIVYIDYVCFSANAALPSKWHIYLQMPRV